MGHVAPGDRTCSHASVEEREWDRVFVGAALTTLLGVGAELAAPEIRQDGDRIVIAFRHGLQDSVNQAEQ